ncbi:MAG: hypothetical protein QOE49_2249 [Rhodospirillaceae bacterium]|nr:hypothetical protein [Rhodospirillaceae bacterium]
MQQYRDSVLGILACLVGLTMAAAAHAQAPRSKVEMPATPGVPEFRDPKTGQIWTPLNVGQQSGPPTPADLAFDPMGQAVSVRGVVVQRPSVVPLDAVPITAGPTVPIVNLGDATLRAVPGKRWQVVLYLDNNSAGVVLPVINCRFTNAGNLVEQTHVLVPAVGPGLRVGMTIYGPKTDLFVDRAACAVTSP